VIYVFNDAAGGALVLSEPWTGVGHTVCGVLDDRANTTGHLNEYVVMEEGVCSELTRRSGW
jgi:hypothetical protein